MTKTKHPAGKPTTVAAYVAALPEPARGAVEKLRAVLRKNLPKGFEEQLSYGMIGYVVPKRLYPAGYHAKPELPLPFIHVAAQKGHVAVYHMGLYAGPLLEWFEGAWKKQAKTKLNMGKSCVRFKDTAAIPYALLGELATKLNPAAWIAIYESALAASRGAATKRSKPSKRKARPAKQAKRAAKKTAKKAPRKAPARRAAKKR